MRPSLLPIVLAAFLAGGCALFESHKVRNYDTAGNAMDVYVTGDTLFVADGDSGLLALDISVPDRPRQLWRTALGRNCSSVIVIGACAYVGSDSGGVVLWLPTFERVEFYGGGTSRNFAGFACEPNRLYVAATDGVNVFDITQPLEVRLVRFVPISGTPTGVARRDSRLFVSCRDWGVHIFHVLPNDSLVADTMRLGKRNRAEAVAVTAGGYCIVSQADSGAVMYYTPDADTVRQIAGWGGGGRATYSVAATAGVEEVRMYCADSVEVSTATHINRLGHVSISCESDIGDFDGFTRRIVLSGKGYAYTASGIAGVYVVK